MRGSKEGEEGGSGDAIVSYPRSQALPSFPSLAVPYWVTENWVELGNEANSFLNCAF